VKPTESEKWRFGLWEAASDSNFASRGGAVVPPSIGQGAYPRLFKIEVQYQKYSSTACHGVFSVICYPILYEASSLASLAGLMR
jgi:hypothetical protein